MGPGTFDQRKRAQTYDRRSQTGKPGEDVFRNVPDPMQIIGVLQPGKPSVSPLTWHSSSTRQEFSNALSSERIGPKMIVSE
jgi:hypothetical protein